MKTLRVAIISVFGALLLVALLLPFFARVKSGRGTSCVFNLRLIQNAKRMYADDFKLTNDVLFTKEQLLPYGLRGKWPQCPAGGDYIIGTLHESPRCSYPNHAHLQVSPQ